MKLVATMVLYSAFGMMRLAAQTAVTTSGGTANTVPLFAGTASLGNSVIYQANGRVGIGTNSPGSSLHIYGSGDQVAFMQSTTSGNPGTSFLNTVGGYSNQLDETNASLYWFNGSTRNMTLLQSGSLGIGTSAPGELLDVVGNPAFGTATERLSLGSMAIGFNRRIATGAIYNAAAYAYQFEHTESSSPGSDNLALQVYAPSGASVNYKALTVNGYGQVGIGTALILPDGSLQTTAWTGVLCGGDYAESVDVAGGKARYEPGDVMVVDPENAGGFLKSAEPYSTLVAGIYSTKPGAVGRRFTDPDRAKDSVPMAMVGIVPTKVSAENGPVKPGDLLVTSSTAGYAMKGTDRERLTGAILGKALGSVASGAGVIEVLVSLQ